MSASSPFFFGDEMLPNQFPVADADQLLAAVVGEFAVEERAGRLGLAQQRGGKADAVDGGGNLGVLPDESEQCRHPIFEAGDAIGGGAGGKFSFPSDDAGDAEASFVEGFLAVAEAAGGVEEQRIESRPGSVSRR